jgi:hypothetical protein
MTQTECISGAVPSSGDRTIDIKAFYQRLAGLGFPRKFVREVLLPDWWCDEYEQQGGAVVEAAAYVSRRTNFDFSALLDEGQSLFLRKVANPCYKIRQGTQEGSLTNASAMAERVAELAAYAYTQPLQSFDHIDSKAIHKKILVDSDFVTLENLLIFCWESGIPVIHTNCFPKGTGQKKFDGMVGKYGDRPVILISNNRKSSAWLAFIVAHELGHIICNHIKDSSIIDEKIEPNEQEDEQELEADQFAIEVLFGRKNAGYYSLENFNASSLVSYAKAWCRLDHVNPASVVLNYAWFKAKIAISETTKRSVWAIANQALKEFEGDSIASQVINQELAQRLAWETLSSDNQAFLERMTGIEVGALASH